MGVNLGNLITIYGIYPPNTGVEENHGKEVMKERRGSQELKNTIFPVEEPTGTEQDIWKKILMKVQNVKKKTF